MELNINTDIAAVRYVQLSKAKSSKQAERAMGLLGPQA